MHADEVEHGRCAPRRTWPVLVGKSIFLLEKEKHCRAGFFSAESAVSLLISGGVSFRWGSL